METYIPILLPFVLLLGRISAFVGVLPIFGWNALPVRVRAAIAILLTIFFATITPRPGGIESIHWVSAVFLVVREIGYGLALGLAVRLVFTAAQQAGRIAGRQMGFALASIIDPVSGEQGQPIGLLFEVAFTVFFLAAGGHHLLILMIAGSYEAFPIAAAPSMAFLAEGVLNAGSTMLMFALKTAAPLLAAFLLLSVVLALLARVLPEMNVLLASLPLRVGMGFFMAAAIMPTLNELADDLAAWMNRSLIC